MTIAAANWIARCRSVAADAASAGPLIEALGGRLLRGLACFACLGLPAPGAAAEARFPVAGSYGFDWLHPRTARCVRIAEAEAARWRGCEFSRSFSFGLDKAAYRCRAGPRSEFIVLSTRRDCQATLETMAANAP